jgi:tetratricopeptide (TPR) repeat protein
MSDLPTVISFCCGDDYYFKAADRLRADCDRLGVPHDIEELQPDPGLDWSEICRQKIPFYRRKLLEHEGPVLWIDVDCRLRKAPETLRGCQFDLAGFAQGFRYIRDFDPYDTVRFWVPGVLFINATPDGLAFVELMQEIDRTAGDARVTDDYVLHEAWTTFERPLNVGLLRPTTVVGTLRDVTDDTVFVYGASGNVAQYRASVLQHERRDLLANPRTAARILELHDTPQVRAHVLTDVARDLARKKDRETARRVMRAAAEIVPEDLAVATRYAAMLRRAGELEEAYGVLAQFLERDPADGKALLAMAQLGLTAGDLPTAREYVTRLVEHPDAEWSDLGRSVESELELDERAEALGLTVRERTPLWWMRHPRPGNFGDVLSPYIVEKVTGRPPRIAARHKSLLAIGSVIKFAGAESDVWGTGTPRITDELSSEARYHAVRGPLTRELVLRDGGSCPEVYGDPGLLLPRFYSPSSESKLYAVGLIRHVGHALEAEIGEGVREISLKRVGHRDIERFVDELAECEVVLTTSLHGLITAHAYGIPARWCELSDQPTAVPGDGTKYRDYFQSVDMPEQEPLDLSGLAVIDERLAGRVDPAVDLQFSADRLIDAFPDL